MDDDDSVLGFAANWVRSFASEVEHIDVITMRSGSLHTPSNVKVWSLAGPHETGLSSWTQTIRFYRALAKIIRRNRPDGCFSHMNQKMSILAAPVLRMSGVPIITWYAHPRCGWSVMLADHLCNAMVTSVSSAYPYRRTKLFVIGQGIDTKLFRRDPAITIDRSLVLCVGRVSRVKGHKTLIAAIGRLRDSGNTSVRLHIVGDSLTPDDHKYRREVMRQIEDLQLVKQVHIQEGRPPRKLPALYNSCVVHVNLTPTGFGDKVAWESMACGRPCIACNDDFSETFGEHRETLLFGHNDDVKLAERLANLLAKSDREQDEIGEFLALQVRTLHGLPQLVSRVLGLMVRVAQK